MNKLWRLGNRLSKMGGGGTTKNFNTSLIEKSFDLALSAILNCRNCLWNDFLS